MITELPHYDGKSFKRNYTQDKLPELTDAATAHSASTLYATLLGSRVYMYLNSSRCNEMVLLFSRDIMSATVT